VGETIEPSANFAPGFRAKLEARPQPWWKRVAAFRPKQLAAAGALAAVLFAGVLLIRHPGNHADRPNYSGALKPVEAIELPEDMAVISNLDLLENFDTIEDLQRLLKEAH